MKTFEQILQQEYGTQDNMQYILARLTKKEILKCVNDYATKY